MIEVILASVLSCYAGVSGHLNAKGPASFVETLAKTSGIKDPTTLKQLIVLYAIESRFNPAAKSRAGARGIGQLMWPTAKEAADELNLVITKKKLYDLRTNLRISSYLYNKYLTMYAGNVTLVLVAYNGGHRRANNLTKLRPLPNETNAYVTKFNYLYERHCK